MICFLQQRYDGFVEGQLINPSKVVVIFFQNEKSEPHDSLFPHFIAYLGIPMANSRKCV